MAAREGSEDREPATKTGLDQIITIDLPPTVHETPPDEAPPG